MIRIYRELKMWYVEIDGQIFAEGETKSEVLQIARGEITSSLNEDVVAFDGNVADVLHRRKKTARRKSSEQ